MKLPLSFLQSIEGLYGYNRQAFEKIHASANQITSIRVNPSKTSSIQHLASNISPTPWCDTGYYMGDRPSFTFDPLFHAGCYYVQEASSMFLEQALKQTVDLSKPLKVLDLCAAPGGKSTHIQSLISKESLLVSNEVIRSRAGILKDNIIKWGSANGMVTNNDPKDFARFENYFDVIVVDAPCSGSGLFRREPEAVHEWSENNVQLCSQRQQRILADVWPALKNGGILIYSTCSYSKEEDEDIVSWLLNEFSIAHCSLPIDPAWGIVDTGKGYRFWPDKVKGEGFFLACFRKKDGAESFASIIKRKPELVTKKELDIIKHWVKTPGSSFIKNQQTVYAWPEIQFNDFNFLLGQLRVIYSGVLVGELMRDKLVPDHALAMGSLLTTAIQRTELSYEQSIRYLQRKDLDTEVADKGWQIVTYQDHPLGWINALPNRINNYYPKELRILKDN
ncbi:MAG: methyltransferase RsmF C-terminal domain-like protein [Bacteroidota bacterium]